MIHSQVTNQTVKNQYENPELSRVLSAAVINKQFCIQLLQDPVRAISGGYDGENFKLEKGLMRKLKTIHAGNLAEIAAQLST